MSAARVILAEYFTTDEATYLFIVRSDFEEPEVLEINLTLEAIQQFVFKHFRAEQNAAVDSSASTREKILELDETAYQNFFAPLVEPLTAISHKGDEMSARGDIIWFVPHDILHYVPLHALSVEGSYLIDRNPVCYTPSASAMKFCQKKRKGRRENALVFADSRNDLAYARGEAVAVAELFNSTPHLNEQATKSLLLEKIKHERDSLDILHFSCHGYFDSDDALKSGIMLAPEADGEGGATPAGKWSLTAREIFSLDLKADLVTLSACDSGINERKPGDELIGLTRALIFAGTPSVVVSLWAVDDLSTSLLAQRFYQELCRPASPGNPACGKAEALQAAQQFVKGLTARQVIDYCEQQLSAPSRFEDATLKLHLLISQANAQVVAGDLQAAIASYQNVQSQIAAAGTEEFSELAHQVVEALDILQFQSDESLTQAIDYDLKPFAHPYYWAPFILVGDWK